MILKTKLNVELTEEERLYIFRKCGQLGINMEGIRVWRNKGLSWDGAVACFSLLHPNELFICNDQKSMPHLLPYIAHEYIHRAQFKSMGFLRYCFCAFPLWRKWTLEKEAYAFEDKVRDILMS